MPEPLISPHFSHPLTCTVGGILSWDAFGQNCAWPIYWPCVHFSAMSSENGWMIFIPHNLSLQPDSGSEYAWTYQKIKLPSLLSEPKRLRPSWRGQFPAVIGVLSRHFLSNPWPPILSWSPSLKIYMILPSVEVGAHSLSFWDFA